jgi:ribosomal protein L24E
MRFLSLLGRRSAKISLLAVIAAVVMAVSLTSFTVPAQAASSVYVTVSNGNRTCGNPNAFSGAGKTNAASGQLFNIAFSFQGVNGGSEANLWSDGSFQFTYNATNAAYGESNINLPTSALVVNYTVYNNFIPFQGGTFTLNAVNCSGISGPHPPTTAPIVGMTSTVDGKGYWEVSSDGNVYNFGDAGNFGSELGDPLSRPVVGMASTPDGKGYWLVATDGGIFSFGDAQFYGSTGNIHLNQPIVGMTSTVDGKGYWFVASDGGIFSYGDARFQGSMGATHLNQPVVGMAVDNATGGYWLVASDGGIFAFNASFLGSTGATRLNQPVNGMEAASDGSGYRFVAADGGIFSFGLPFSGSMGGKPLNKPVVGMAAYGTNGYWLVASDGGLFNFGGAPFMGVPGS